MIRRKFLPWQKLEDQRNDRYVCIDPTTGKPAIELSKFNHWKWVITINGFSNRGTYSGAMKFEDVQFKVQDMAEYFGFKVGDGKLLNML